LFRILHRNFSALSVINVVSVALTFLSTMNRARSSVKVSKYFQRVFARNFHASVANCMRVCSCCQQHKRPEPDFKVHDYNKVFRRSIDSPEDFWAEQADDLIWEKKWDKVLDNSNPPFTKWYKHMFKKFKPNTGFQ
jgi:hypothetical protein